MNKYAAHLFIFTCGKTEPAEAPPQLLIYSLEKPLTSYRGFPTWSQHWKTAVEFTVVQMMHKAASGKGGVYPLPGSFWFFWTSKRTTSPRLRKQTNKFFSRLFLKKNFPHKFK